MAKATYGKAFPGNPIKNNGATVMYGRVNGFITQALGMTTVGLRSGVSGSKVVLLTHEPALNSTGKILSGGPFAQMRINKYMIVKVTKEIATIANLSIYMGPNTSWRKSINYNENQNTLVTKNIGINYFTGKYLSDLVVQKDSFGNDVAAHPTRAVPGKILYQGGIVTKGPIIKTYSAKNS